MRGNVSGYVVRAGTGEAVPGAVVVCGRNGVPPGQTRGLDEPRRTSLTDRAGCFRFEDLPCGDWIMKTRAARGDRLVEGMVSVFDDASSEITLEVADRSWHDASIQPLPSQRAELAARHGSVRGRVIDAASGAPISYATLIVVRGAGPVPGHVFTASAAGWFELNEVPVGDWLLRARRDGGETGSGTVRVYADALSELTIEVDGMPDVAPWVPAPGQIFDLEEPAMFGRVIGHVNDARTGRPIADAAVTIVRGAGPTPDIAPLTDRQGRFALDDLPAGSWLLRATAPDGDTGVAQVSVLADRIAETLIRIGVR